MALRRRGPWSKALATALVFVVGALASACEGDTLYEPTGPDNGGPGGPGGPNGPVVEPAVNLAIALETGDRIELTDSLHLTLSAWDSTATSAIERLGYTLVVTLESGSRAAVTGETTFPTATAGDTVTTSVTVAPTWLTAAIVPAAFELQAYVYAFNRDGDCRAAVPDAPDMDFACALEEVAGQSYRISATRAERVPILAVAGRTTLFPSSAFRIGDMAVDHARGNVFLSNRLANHLQVFRPGDHAWGPQVAVGSEPWGLHLNSTGDTLLVANSGGTSISHVALSGSGGQEIVARRLQTRNTALYQFALARGEPVEEGEVPDDVANPLLVESFEVFDFSDRPQFVAQDAQGRTVYSTRPTAAAPTGTMRWVRNQAGWAEPETRIFVRLGGNSVGEELDLVAAEGSVVAAHADSIKVFFDGRIQVWDHRPGFPADIVASPIAPPLVALEHMRASANSDVEYFEDAAWEIEAVSFSDTTYVASSANREYVAFGDGGAGADPGKILLWHAGTATISARLSVTDLVNNASERVNALELNSNGSLGVARGAFGTYFFSNDLRLRGTVPEPFAGGGGAAFHPSHPGVALPSAPSASTLAFTVSGDRVIRILDTVHYLERGSIPIRDALAGPLRVSPPLASDNEGFGASCSGPECVVAKVYAVTQAGGVVVVDVRA
jgi:hypothetical protein